MNGEVKVWVSDVDGWKVGINSESAGYMTPDEADEVARSIAAAANEARAKTDPRRFEPHDFEVKANDEMGCAVCDEGICYYLHTRWCEGCDNREPECECEDEKS